MAHDSSDRTKEFDKLKNELEKEKKLSQSLSEIIS
jgi:hypothetical protein